TGTFCRVPSPQVTRAPEASRLAYVCPFAVRSSKALPTEAFLGSRLQQTPGPPKGPVALPSRLPGPFNSPGTYAVRPGFPPPGSAFAPASPLWVITHSRWYRNIDLFPIVYALRPRLRDRLTRGG